MPRYLVVVNDALRIDPLLAALHARASADDARYHVVVPATPPSPALAAVAELEGAGDDAARALARTRLRAILLRLTERLIDADGEVGAPDPLEAIATALERVSCDAILVSTAPAGASRFVGRDLLTRIRRRFDLPVVHLESGESGDPVPA